MPADHGVDADPVGFGVRQPRQREHPQALAEHGAVGGVGERPAVAGGRERRGLGEAQVHGVVGSVDAAGDHQVGATQAELVDPHRQRRQRTGAGGVDVQLVPCRSNRLAMRPATTLLSRPGNVASCHGR